MGMLVLSRRKNESIVIGGNITVTVVQICGDKVRLGILAPKEIPVFRQEIQDQINAVNAKEQASGADQTRHPATDSPKTEQPQRPSSF